MNAATQTRVSQATSTVDQLFAKADHAFLISAISQQEGEFLRSLSSRPDVRNTVEVGCANGISSIYICAGLAGKQGAHHIAIDPCQTSLFQGRGAANVRNAGFDFFEVIEAGSEEALPSLMAEGKRFDMGLIDGLHTADQTMVDFYYMDRLIRPGGIIVIDDVEMPAVRKIARYAATYGNYKVIGISGKRFLRRKLLNITKQVLATLLWPVRKIVGEAIMREYWDISVLHPQHIWDIDNCTMLAFEKTRDEVRDTVWYEGL